MMSLRIEGATRAMAKDQAEYNTLWICDTVVGGVPLMESMWELDPRELVNVKNGAPIWVGLMLGDGTTTTAWLEAPDKEELDMIVKGGRVRLSVPGTVFPPVQILVASPEEAPFLTPPADPLVFVDVLPVYEDVPA